MSKTILFATDYSADSGKVLKLATTLARQEHAKLLIVHVTTLEKTPVGELFDEEPKPDPLEMQRLKTIVPPDPNVTFEHRLLYGEPGSVKETNPADEIIKLAKQEKVEMIVLGTHGRTGLSHLLMGSVAEAVVRNSPCQVVSMKLPAKAAEKTKAANSKLDRRSIDALNQLLLAQRFSLAIYLKDGHTWTNRGDEPLERTILKIANDHELTTNCMNKLLVDRVGQVPHGHFPVEFTEHDETALDYLVPELVRREQQMVERIEQALSNLGPEPEVRELVELLLSVEKGHVTTLTEVQQTLEKAT